MAANLRNSQKVFQNLILSLTEFQNQKASLLRIPFCICPDEVSRKVESELEQLKCAGEYNGQQVMKSTRVVSHGFQTVTLNT